MSFRQAFVCVVMALAVASACLHAAPAETAPAVSEQLPDALAHQLHQAVSVPDYEKATAADPQFASRALWPMLGGKEAFVQQKWPETRTIVWANPGESGTYNPKRVGMDPLDPASWRDGNGKPLTELVLDENTDLVLPPADKPYKVGFRSSGTREILRHVTVGRNANFEGGGDGFGRSVYGNVWIKSGGRMYSQGAMTFLGAAHTFVRNDNIEEKPAPRSPSLHMIAQYFTFNKAPEASVEFIGRLTTLDEFRVLSGTAIVSPDSRLQSGRAAAPVIEAQGTLAILDGGYYGSWVNNFDSSDMQVRGTVSGGLPDRPLSRDAYFGIGFKNFTDAPFGGATTGGRAPTVRRVTSLLLASDAKLVSYASSGPTAMLTVLPLPGGKGEREACRIRPLPGSEEEQQVLKRAPEAQKTFDWFDALPRGLDVWIADSATVKRVRFIGLRAGGVLLQSTAAKSALHDVKIADDPTVSDAMTTVVPKIAADGAY